ncbi:MAG: PAS domain S-box protein [Deltaproteobacteria bacterium]|nr:PAS domain S-box protein [Deltaproteobacteria bacterium]
MATALKVLIVEDSEDDAFLIASELELAGHKPIWKRVETSQAMQEALRTDSWDVCIADYAMPRFSGPAALELVKELGLDLPFILVSGKIGEEAAVEMMKAGAHDYIMKDKLARLAPAIQREIREAEMRAEHRRAEEALRRSEERFRAVIESAQDCIFIKDRNLRYTHVNSAMASLTGVRVWELLGKDAEFIFGEEAAEHIREVDLRVLSGESIEEEHTRPVRGVELVFHDTLVPLRDPRGEIIGLCGISRNITERKKAAPVAPVKIEDFPSKTMRETMQQARQAAATNSLVLLLGESGSGKDYLARWIHDHSRRASGPFFAINCAAVPGELAESELFGHEPGAFTGTRGRKRGLLELAEGGTLLLNEIGELSLPLQSKLLTFLDTKSFLRVGGEKSIHVNARLIAATNRNLQEEVSEKRFLEALFYRLNVFTIHIPPLRDRTEDIPVIVEEIMSSLAADMQLPELPVIDPQGMSRLTQYYWPGNVRELRNVLERALMLWDKSGFDIGLPRPNPGSEDWSYVVRFPTKRRLNEVTDDVAKLLCEEALRRTDGSKTGAARLLGVSRYTFYRHMKAYGIAGEDETVA